MVASAEGGSTHGPDKVGPNCVVMCKCIPGKEAAAFGDEGLVGHRAALRQAVDKLPAAERKRLKKEAEALAGAASVERGRERRS